MDDIKKGTHHEEEWVEIIKDELQKKLEDKYVVECGKRLNYKISLNDYLDTDKNISIKEMSKTDNTFKVDLFIGEKKDNHIIPRLIIEAKYKDINTHDPITYSYKAELHKNLYPGLRYGLMVGNYGVRGNGRKRNDDDIYIPTRCVTFGDNFDFIFLFKEDIPTSEEMEKFVEIIDKNLKTSEKLENFLTNKEKYWYIAKDIKFSDDNEEKEMK